MRALLWACGIALITAMACEMTGPAFAQAAADRDPSRTQAAPQQANELGAFVAETLTAMGTPDGTVLPGLSDADTVALGNVRTLTKDFVTATLSAAGSAFNIVRYTPEDKSKSFLLLRTSKINLGSLIPNAEGMPLAALGTLQNVFFIYAPSNASGPIALPAMASDDSDSAPPKIIDDIRALAGAGVRLTPGLSIAAALPVRDMSKPYAGLMRAAGVAANAALPLRGSLPSNFFKDAFSGRPAAVRASLSSGAQLGSKFAALERRYGKSFFDGFLISAPLSRVQKVEPFEFDGLSFQFQGDGKGGVSAGVSAASMRAHGIEFEKVRIALDPGSGAPVASGAVKVTTLAKHVRFKGLSFGSVELASVFEANGWRFRVEGAATLNGKQVRFTLAPSGVQRAADSKLQTTLSGGTQGITLRDIAGRDVPGFDKMALTQVLLTDDSLTADLKFGAKEIPGELAAFHPQGAESPVLAVTLDKLTFGDLIPGSLGSALDGVSIDAGTLVVLPTGGLRPDDPSVPKHIADNLKRVIADAAKHDASKANHTLTAGFNLLADLDIRGSRGMGQLMASGGVTETVIPIVGTISASTFDKSASKADGLKGLDLRVALPDLKVPGLPSTIKIAKPVFAVTEGAPAALKQPAGAPALAGPFITIGADLVMQAGSGSHAFDALLLAGKDARGRAVVDLLGSAEAPKGLFTFKGLSVRTLDLASAFEGGTWNFKLDGSADLNGAALSFDTEITNQGGKATYVATLSGGTKGISLKDVAGRDVAGFDKVALTQVVVTNDRLIADLKFGAKGIAGEVAAFHPQGADKAVLAVTLDKLPFGDLVPGSAGSALDGVSVDGLTLVVIPSGSLRPNDPAVPKHIADNLRRVIADAAKHDASKANHTLTAGFNLLADLDIQGSKGMGRLMASGGVTETVIPIVGTISASTFATGASKADGLKDLDLSVALPDLRVPGLPSTIKITKPVFAVTETAPTALKQPAGAPALAGPFITIGADLVMQAGSGSHEFDALLMAGKDAKGKPVIDLLGAAKAPKGLFTFKGLSVKALELASIYEGGNWDFQLDGSADLNGASLTFDTEITNQSGKVTYVATLSGGTKGITLKDVAGREVPGFDKVALTQVVVTNDSLVADLKFGAKGIPGEVAAFHPSGADKAVLAVTLDKMPFGDLVPGSVGSTLDGVSVDELTLVVLPAGTLKPNDPSVPKHIAGNLTRVIADAARHDASKANHTLTAGFNLLADLDIQGSKGMGRLMASGGVTETVIPIVGRISASTFDRSASKSDGLKGLDLSVALPNLRVPGLPSTIKVTKPVFAVTETAPAALKQPTGAPTLAGPFITIGADLVMQAGSGAHEFDALLMAGKDTKGKPVIDLVGAAKAPKGLFTFKGLSVKALELASVFEGGKWDFQLNGSADLNGANLSFDTEVTNQSGKVAYVATLSGGTKGISLKDIAGRDVPGFDKVALTQVVVTNDSLVADLKFGAKGIPGEVAAFHPAGADKAVLAVTLDKLPFGDLVPGSVGSTLDGVSVDELTLVVLPGGTLKPNDPAVPKHIADNLTRVIADAAKHDASKANHTLTAGFNLLADLDVQGSKGMGRLMASGGITESVIPIVGTISASTFDRNASKSDGLKGLDLSVALPDLKVPGLPSTIKITKPVFAVTETAPAALKQPTGAPALAGPFITIGADLVMQAGSGSHEFDALLMAGKDSKGKPVIDLLGAAKAPKGLFTFKGLSVKSLELASVFEGSTWDFQLDGAADLNGAALTFDTEITNQSGKVTYVATLSGGTKGISLKDVAGRDVPGFDKVALTQVVVTNDSLIADLKFGVKGVPGEVAAFHPKGADKAVLAVTLDKLAFADLVPGAVGSTLDGVSVDELTLVVLPAGTLKPDDPSMPKHIADNLTRVITDAAKHDASKASHTLTAGFNLLADLDIQGSKGMGRLMASGGVTETVIPIVGTVSRSTFDRSAPKADGLKGLDLSVALPDLKVPGLPSTITITKPVFAVTETAPAALKQPAGAPALAGPFITIGADLVMQAGSGSHEFDALLMAGKDSKGKAVVDLLGSAMAPKGLFTFKGLSVKTLDLASVFEGGSWDFQLDGSADLNGAALTFDTEVTNQSGKVTYVATLSGGTKGISLKDVAGRDVPGFDKVALTQVVVTNDSLVADLKFGAKGTPGEIAAFHPKGVDKAVLAVTLDKLPFGDLVPGSVGSVLDGTSVDELTVVVLPSGTLKPDDPSVPKHIADNLTRVIADAAKHDASKAGHTLTAGFNLLADLDIRGSKGMGRLMASGGVTETVIPIVGTIGAPTFDHSAAKADSLKGLDLSVALPDLKVPGLPSTITITKPVFAVTEAAPAALKQSKGAPALAGPFITIGADLVMQAGSGSHEFDALLMAGKDTKGKAVIDLLGAAKAPKGLFTFKGLSVKTLELASVFEGGTWDFQLDGSAALNGADLTFDTEITNQSGKVTYVATLSGGTKGISLKDVAGRDVPGFDKVALTQVVVTNDSLVADLKFGGKGIPAELAAFHPKGADKAVLAVTLDKLAFGDLVPGAAGSPLDGVSVDELSLVVLPTGTLKPDDPSVPKHIADNLTRVIADAAKHDASKANHTLTAGFNLLADLDIKGSKGMGRLMASGGVTETVIPIVGTISASSFDKGASKADGLKGLDLAVALPDLKVPGLPSTITITKPVFAITEAAPAALKQPAGAPGLAGPFVTIGVDLVMQAGSGSHEFDALLMTGKDTKGKAVIDLLGAAKAPKGLFTFKGLSVKTLELASVFEGTKWDFQLDGAADLNGADLTFNTEITNQGGKVTYIATLRGGTKGISLKDVAGRDMPGFDKVALTQVVVTNDSLVADLKFGAKGIPAELAAFHPKGVDKAVLAVSLDKADFADLIPVGTGHALDGVGLSDLTLVVVPPKAAGLKPGDPAMPKHIAANLTKVLTDAGKGSNYALKQNVNLFGELDLGSSKPMQDLMTFIGRDPKAGLPLSGFMGPHLFDLKAKAADRLKGMDLDLPLPKVNLANLPGAFTLSKAAFHISDKDAAGKAALWVGLKSDISADLLGKKIAFASNVGFSKGEIAMEASSTEELKAPFGIHWLDLKDLDLRLDYNKETKTGELLFKAVPSKPFGKKRPKIEIELKEAGGKLTAGVLKIQEKVAFADLPILSKVPHADQFDFTFLEISKSGVSGGSQLHGQEVDAVLFEQGGKWVIAVSDDGGGKGFKFGRIIPAIGHTPLKDFHLNDAALIFSQQDIDGTVDKLPEVAQTVFSEIYGSKTAKVTVKNGITVAANFSPGKSTGFAAKGMQGIGIHDDILIEGTIENIFGGKGTPGIDVLVDIKQGPGGKKGASHTPKMAKFPGTVGFFIQYKADELDVGLAADVVLHVPKKQKLDLVAKLELELNEKGFGVDIFLDLTGTWKKPFGIPGVELDEVALKFGIDMEGEAKFGFHGKAELADGAEKIDIAAEMDFELDAGGLPDGIALRGSITELGIPAIIDVAERMAGGGANILPPKDIPLPEFRDVVFAFATPGATDPQLGLVSEGFKIGGELYFMGRELGQIHLNAGPKTGVHLDAEIDPIDLKVLKLDKNKMLFDLSFKSLPKLEIDSKIEFLGAEQDVEVKFDHGMVNLGFEEKIGGGIWDSKFDLGFGFNTANKGIPDIFVEGEVKSDFFGWLRNKAPEKVHEFFNKLNEKFEEAKAAINNAEAVVRSWDGKIRARKEVVQREKAQADAAIHRAEARVRSVLRDVNHAHDQAEYHKHHCHWYSAWHCGEEAYWWVRYGIEYAAYEVAEGVLHAAQETVDHLPAELMDPQLDALEVERAAAMTALEIAKAVISGVEEADKWIDKGLETLLKEIGSTNALVIKEIFFEADLDGLVKGQPAILTMDLEIFGDDLGTQMFAFKLTDPVFDAEQLAFIPLHMVSELFKKYLPKAFNKLLGPIYKAIDAESRAAMKKVHDELKNVPGVKLPPEVQAALQQAALEVDDGRDVADAKPKTVSPFMRAFVDRVRNAVLEQTGIKLAQLTSPNVMSDAAHPRLIRVQVQADGTATRDADKAPAKQNLAALTPVEQRMEAFREKRRNLLVHIMERNKAFGESVIQFEKEQAEERRRNENDQFVAYTDTRVPPGELFTERLLVARHSKLCLGQNGQGKITFHPCSENPGGLLWSTKRVLVDMKGHTIAWNDGFAKRFPNRVYAQLVHNGACLTTPFHLEKYDIPARQAHFERLRRLADGKPSAVDAHLKLGACRNDGKGQLWKVVKTTHSRNVKEHGFKLQERDSAFCLRPESVKAHTKKSDKEVKGVFYPCSGIAHGTFTLTPPNSDMPVWYDHNGVIKSDNGFCLDVPNDPAANANGSTVSLKTCANDQYDRWDYVVEYDKTVKIINDFTGYCLYPYDVAEGKISGARTGQLVQRPCDGRYGQGWTMRVIPKQKWFQLEALDKTKKPTGTCMIPAKADPGQTEVDVFVQDCDPATRGRWEFGHWKGTYEWTEWTLSNASGLGAADLSNTYWVDKGDLNTTQRNGVCRVIRGNHAASGGRYDIVPGTWNGASGTCSYLENGAQVRVKPSEPEGADIIVEVLSGLDIGVPGATASWKASAAGLPVDSAGQAAVPPAPRYAPFLVGGTARESALYLCRAKGTVDKVWHYGYQSATAACVTEVGAAVSGGSEVLVFQTVKN